MLSRIVRIQLVAFAVITTVTLVIMSLYYVKIPQQLGVGRYGVTVQLADAGGLYPKANVSYRGAEIGQVEKVELRPGGGVLVHIQINDGADVPADSNAMVRSASVIGEQYIDFVPPTTPEMIGSSAPVAVAATGTVLKEGSVIPVSHTDLPTTTEEVLSSTDDLIQSIPLEDLSNTLAELSAAFGDSGDDLSKLISSSSEFVEAANKNSAPTISLINDLGPVLQTQKDMDPNIRSFVRSLDDVTGALAKNNKDLRTIFTSSGTFLKQIRGWGDAMNPVFPKILTDTANVGEVVNVYDPAVQHILAVVPALQTMFLSAMPVNRRNLPFPSVNLDLRVALDSPVCTTGFPSANKFRDPDDKTVLPVPSDTYCKVAPNSPIAVRGARNSPCPNSNLRGPYAFSCGLVFNKAEVAIQKALIARGDPPNPSNGGSANGGNSPLVSLLAGLTGP